MHRNAWNFLQVKIMKVKMFSPSVGSCMHTTLALRTSYHFALVQAGNWGAMECLKQAVVDSKMMKQAVLD